MASTEAGTGLTERLATFYNGLDYESLSPETVDRAKYFCLDYLSVAIRGAITPSSEAMRRALKTPHPRRGFSGHGHRTTCVA